MILSFRRRLAIPLLAAWLLSAAWPAHAELSTLPEPPGLDPTPTVAVAATGLDRDTRAAFWAAAEACRQISNCIPIEASYQTRPGEPLSFMAATDVGASAVLARAVRDASKGVALEVEGYSSNPFAPSACASLATAIASVRMAAFPGKQFAKSPCAGSDRPLREMHVYFKLTTRLPPSQPVSRFSDPAFLVLMLYALAATATIVPLWWFGLRRHGLRAD